MIVHLARLAVVVAVVLQSVGKVTYGSFLSGFPAPAFVFIAFSLATIIFWCAPNRKIGVIDWPILAALNIATACTFISVFVALKVIGPASVGAIEIGVGPIFAALFAVILMAEHVGKGRAVICVGILLGCFILGYAALDATDQNQGHRDIIFALFLSILAGAGAVVISMASKSLMTKGWNQAAVLSHRSYVIIPVSFGLWLLGGYESVAWTLNLTIEVVVIGAISVIIPLYLLLVGLKHCDVYTVMVTMAVQPCVTFTLEYMSSGYNPSTLTAIGISIITTFVILDVILTTKRASQLQQKRCDQSASRSASFKQS